MSALIRWLGAAVLIAAVTVPAGSAAAAGGTYEVVQCHSLYRGVPDAKVTDNAAYAVRPGCADPDAEHALKIDSVGQASSGQAGRVRWKAPPGTGIVAVHVSTRLRRDDGHKARLYMADNQLRETARVATGQNGGTAWQAESWTGPAQDQFVASLHCEGPDPCGESREAKAWIRNVRLTLKDFEDPELEVHGSLLGPGWHRGEGDLQLRGSDLGGGTWALEATMSGVLLVSGSSSCQGVADTTYWVRLLPCGMTQIGAQGFDTSTPPFLDGSNEIEICATDVARNSRCVSETVRIDNSPPALAFQAAQDPEDPELLTVYFSDPHSGVRGGQIYYRPVDEGVWRPLTTELLSGELRARVDSASEPEGEYEFMVEATDVAGNEASTTLREDGTPMRLNFPLKSGVDLDARLRPGGAAVQSLDYGESSRVAGRLETAAGEPMAGEQIVVDEYFGEGALIDHRIRTVTTDEQGRWSSKLPAGPSRSVTAGFAGDQRYLPDETVGGRLAVTTGARFTASRERVREGRKISFRGKVGRLGARIPSRGKLIQLQYHDPTSRRWFTVRNAFYTDSRGRYRFGYKFGSHYETDVKLRFRLRVLPESDWPYRATNTRARRVVVVAR